MNYYSHHIGDYLSATAHLSLLEHGAYRRLIDVYYINESPLPAEIKQVYRLVGARSKEEKEAVDSVLGEFFDKCDDGWRQNRCDHEIGLCNKNRTNGKRGGRPPKNGNPNETQTKPKNNPNETQDETPPSPHHPITPSPIASSEQKESTTTTVVTEKTDSSSSSDSDSGRAKILAGRLMKLEIGRGMSCRVSGADPRVVGWAKAGVSDPVFREAYDMALTQRIDEASEQAINPGFLDVFIAKLVNPSDKQSQARPVAWHESATGIEAKGAELGVDPPKPETGGFPAYKARVFAAAGMQAQAA